MSIGRQVYDIPIFGVSSIVAYDGGNFVRGPHLHRVVPSYHYLKNMPFIWAVGLSMLGQFLIVFAPPFQQVFQTEAIGFRDIMYIAMLSSTILLLDTARKLFLPKVFNDDYKTSPVVTKLGMGLAEKGKTWFFGRGQFYSKADKGAVRTNRGAKSSSVLAL